MKTARKIDVVHMSLPPRERKAKTPKPPRVYDPSFSPRESYAMADAKIVTIFNGKRVVKKYRSGERLTGRLARREDYML